jgi:hypothetical protein
VLTCEQGESASSPTRSSDQLLGWLKQTEEEDPWNGFKKHGSGGTVGVNKSGGCVGGATSSVHAEMGSRDGNSDYRSTG